MKCRKCNKELDEQDQDQYQMVASWPFCLECFQGLLDAPKGEPEAATEAAPEAPSAPPTQAEAEASTPRCHLCNREVVEGQHESLWIWTFCPECYASLTTTPEPLGPSEEEERVEVQASVHPEPMKYVLCKGCGRRIPEPGSKPIDGEPYCPDCFQTQQDSVAEEETGAEPEAPVEDPATEEASPARTTAEPSQCESCERQDLPRDQMQAVEGFLICQACLSTDARLALQIARIRHQKNLQRIKDEID